ncbi:MAG: N-acetyl-gamma-glutamyl-phosphate reductase [Armatimonadetes bacterium]|nr:N-acetyl-gamma-glutamyl-phosphate reductase [Armatimonadota bacterium]MDW8122371.1 N-acetyl-gamma-glutamyl-phosphate reductase [Armatimonadota bacterium]
MSERIKVAVIGATGYTGGELVRLLLHHPMVDITAVLRLSSEESLSLEQAHPHLTGLTSLQCVPYQPDHLKGVQVTFLCVPNGVAMDIARSLLEQGIKVVDLSADFRFHEPEVYERVYRQPHRSPELLRKAVYGLPELHRNEIANASLIANPGCYPISVLIALAPLAKRRLIGPDIIVDSKSGVSGAGRSRLEVGYLFTELFGDFRAYNPGNHRHTPEMIQELTPLFQQTPKLTFTPHLIPISRGILSTIYCHLNEPLTEDEIRNLYQTDYGDEPFVHLLPPGQLPRVKAIAGTNFCHISFARDRFSETLIILSALDNLTKGAAGNAIQCFNLLMGLDERMGLLLPGLMP